VQRTISEGRGTFLIGQLGERSRDGESTDNPPISRGLLARMVLQLCHRTEPLRGRLVEQSHIRVSDRLDVLDRTIEHATFALSSIAGFREEIVDHRIDQRQHSNDRRQARSPIQRLTRLQIDVRARP